MAKPTGRLHEAVAAAGIPIDGVSRSAISFRPEASEAQRQQALAILANFDWSEDAQQQWEKEQARLTAMKMVRDDTSHVKMLRAMAKVIAGSVAVERAKINELVDAVNAAHNSGIARLSVRTWAELERAVEDLLMAGGGDAT